MNKLLIIVGSIIGIIIIIFVSLFIFLTHPRSKGIPTDLSDMLEPTFTPTPAPASFVHFSFTKSFDSAQDKPFSTDLVLSVEKDISAKGIIGIKTTIILNPKGLVTISRDNIQGLFPPPWQYIRKDIGTDGTIRVEAIYLQPGKTGFVIKEDTPFVRLTFLPKQKGTLTLTLDPAGTQILTKENNTKASITRETKETYVIK